VPNRELDAADEGWGHDVSGDADDEEVAQALVEHDLRGHPRVRAAEHDGEGGLARHELGPAGRVRRVLLAPPPRDKAAIALAQAIERLVCADVHSPLPR
jgi:hypothetical protein